MTSPNFVCASSEKPLYGKGTWERNNRIDGAVGTRNLSRKMRSNGRNELTLITDNTLLVLLLRPTSVLHFNAPLTFIIADFNSANQQLQKSSAARINDGESSRIIPFADRTSVTFARRSGVGMKQPPKA